MKQQTKFSLIAIAIFFLNSWTAIGQCTNNYTISQLTGFYCQNATNGHLSAQGISYYSNSTFLWNNGETSREIVGLSSGQYTVTVTDPNSCTYTATYFLTPSPAGIPINFSFSPCNGGILTANVNNGVSYLWNDGSTNNSIQNMASGVYSLTVTDVFGCTGIGTHTVLPHPTAMSASHTSITPASCNANNGRIDLTVTGGTPPYTYYWYPGNATVQDPMNLPAGQAYVYIYDANNCLEVHYVTVSGPTLSVETTDISCGPSNSGSATAIVQGIQNPSYWWNGGGAITPTVTGLTAGQHSVVVTGSGCSLSKFVYINNAGNIWLDIRDTLQNDCTITLEAIHYGGAYPLSYLWNTGETTATILHQPSITNYSVTITEANGCTASDSFVATNMNSSLGGLSVSSVVQDATCGNNDGSINLTITGNAYSFLWSPTGATTQDLTGIAAGNYTVQAINMANGCTYTDAFVVGEFIEALTTNASCGLNNGSISISNPNMSNPSYLWSNGETTASINNLATGNYSVTVTNGSCVRTNTFAIIDAGYTVASIVTPSNCQPSYLTGMVTGGAAPFTYLWNTGETTQNIANPLPTNTYSVTITDFNNCADFVSYVVPNPPTISATYISTNATCNNANGAIDLTVTSGTAPFNFEWSMINANVEDVVGLLPGQYTVTISDNSGCVLPLTGIVVGGQNPISISHAFTYVNANNTGGAIDLTVTGINSASYQWSNGATTQDIYNLSSGNYQVTITDLATSCVFTRWYTLPAPIWGIPNIRIRGYVFDVSATGTCQPSLPLAYQMVRLQPLGLIDFTDVYGYYEFNTTLGGNYTVEYINTTPQTTTVICPSSSSYNIVANAWGNLGLNNFYVTNPPVQDVSINVWDMCSARPGQTYYTRSLYRNVGNTIVNGTIEYDYDNLLNFQYITSSYNTTLTSHDVPNSKLDWSYSNLMPGESRYIDVVFNVPTSLSLGTNLIESVTISPSIGDATPQNNEDVETTIVVNSFDPNDKQVDLYHTGNAWTGGVIYQTEEELEYTIRFQNTGTAPAHVVVIRDTLDANLLPETIREISTKHDADVTLENGNVLVFTFNNIYLPDSSADFAASMGFAKFKINRIAGLPVGTEIENTAAIYFDFNEPIITNTPISIIDVFNAVVDIDNSSLRVETMPNPFNEQLTLKYTLQKSSEVTIRVMNATGQTVHTHTVGQNQQAGVYIEQLKMNDLPSGMYLLSVETGEAIVTKKIVKQ